MLGQRSPQRELFRPDHCLLEHVGVDSFYGFLARHGPELFRDSDFADLYGERGRPSVPPSQMCVLLALQAKDGTSDQEAVDRTAYDIRWKVALGVELEEKLCAKSTLQLFRANLLLNERYLRLFETSVRACGRQGLIKSRKLEVAIDSTPVFGRGAVKDTYNLVSDALRRVVMDCCQLKGWDLDEVVLAQGLGRHFGSSVKGESDLDWSDEQERRVLLGQLVSEAHLALQLAKQALRGYATDAVKAREVRVSVELLVKILGQDIEDDPDDGEGLRIRKGTAKDRIISTTDPEMRHGHKSHSKGFNGYKASVVVETENGVILSTGVQPGNRSDREPAVELIEQASIAAGAKVATALGDTAYGDTQTRKDLCVLGVEVVAKTPPIPSKRGFFKRTVFAIDERRGSAKCPAGKSSIRRTRTRADNGWSYFFSRHDCKGCSLRSQCTPSAIRARTVTIADNSKERDRLLRHQKSKRFRTRYRRRVAAEHAIARLVRHGIRQAKYFGTQKTQMQVALAAMAANLGILAARIDLGRLLRAVMRLRPPVHAAALLAATDLDAKPRGLQLALCRPPF